MNRKAIIRFLAAGIGPLLFPAGSAHAASLNDLAGNWAFVSNTATLDGKRVELFGPNGKGAMMISADGHYTIVIVRAGLPKFASGNRMNGTAEENKAVVSGVNAHYGTLTVDEPAHLLSFHIQGATFPNWDGADQHRSFTLDGDVLTYVIPTSTTGGGSGEVVWKRVR